MSSKDMLIARFQTIPSEYSFNFGYACGSYALVAGIYRCYGISAGLAKCAAVDRIKKEQSLWGGCSFDL